MRKKIVAGNWKMNMNLHEANALYTELKSSKEELSSDVQVIIAPPAIYLGLFSQSKEDGIALCAQNIYFESNGAYTGEVSAEMLKDLGVDYCLVGHSERRALFGESNQDLKKKVDALLSVGITPIYCCGETLEERESGDAFDVVGSQISEALFHLDETSLRKVVIAYEPVWAIGTGVTATSDQAQEVHAEIRKQLSSSFSEELAESISILYGGSCKPSNAVELFANKDVDGGLIGGAALKVETFAPIVNAFEVKELL